MCLSGFRYIYIHYTYISYVCFHQPVRISPSASIVCFSSCVCPSVSSLYLRMLFVTRPKQLLSVYTYAYGCSHCRSPSSRCKLFEVLLHFHPQTNCLKIHNILQSKKKKKGIESRKKKLTMEKLIAV